MQDLLEYLSQQIRQTPDLQKRKYRKDMVKAIINSYPEGTAIRGTEFHVALQYASRSAGGSALIARMLRKGEISRTLLNNPSNYRHRRYAYKVLVPGNTYDEERAASPGEVGQVSEVAVDKQTNQAEEGQYLMEKTYTFEELEKLAIKACFYAGQNLEVSQFLLWLKEV